MAKIGEGDSRWIVTDRPDGQNVNAWHWQEKDLTSSVHALLKKAFAGAELGKTAQFQVISKEAVDVEGEVTVAQRKGKIMCYFELKFAVKFIATLNEGGKVEGKAVITEVDHDSFSNDFEIRISTVNDSSAVENYMQTEGRKALRTIFQRFINDLFEANSVGKNIKTGAVVSKTPQTSSTSGSAPVKTSESKPVAQPTSTSTVDWVIRWRVPIEDLWTVLVDQQRASVYTRAPAKVDPRVGGTFEYLGGTISGYFSEVVHPGKLAFQWRLSSWKSGHFSTVIILLETEERGVTRMQFAQAGIPEGEIERVKQGWNVNFWEPIKIMFGFGMEFL